MTFHGKIVTPDSQWYPLFLTLSKSKIIRPINSTPKVFIKNLYLVSEFTIDKIENNINTFDTAQDYNKVYMSNVLDHIRADFPLCKNDMIANFFEKFSSGTTFYMAAGNNQSFDNYPSLHVNTNLSKKLTAVDDLWNVYVLTKK